MNETNQTIEVRPSEKNNLIEKSFENNPWPFCIFLCVVAVCFASIIMGRWPWNRE